MIEIICGLPPGKKIEYFIDRYGNLYHRNEYNRVSKEGESPIIVDYDFLVKLPQPLGIDICDSVYTITGRSWDDYNVILYKNNYDLYKGKNAERIFAEYDPCERHIHVKQISSFEYYCMKRMRKFEDNINEFNKSEIEIIPDETV